MESRLTAYAKSHLILVGIDRRFEAVVARHPKRNEERMKWRVKHARKMGEIDFQFFPDYVALFDIAVHKRYSK